MSVDELTVVITRPFDQMTNLAGLCEQRGFKVFKFPVLEIKPLALNAAAQKVISDMYACHYEWLIFTSRNGVKYLHAIQESNRYVLPDTLKIAVQGKQTGALFEDLFKRPPDLMPEEFVSDQLGIALVRKATYGAKMLIPGALESREILPNILLEAGMQVDCLAVYQTVSAAPSAADTRRLLSLNPQNIIFTFFSPSAFRSTLSILSAHSDYLRAAKLAAVGPVTADEIKSLGFTSFVVADEHTDIGLIEAIAAKF